MHMPDDFALKRLLVVDDDDSIRMTIREALGCRYEIREAANGGEAVEQAESFRADVVLLDVGLPDQTGFQVCRKLRSRGLCTGAPVLFLTASGSYSDMESAMAAGANIFMTKPFEMHELENWIQYLINRPR